VNNWMIFFSWVDMFFRFLWDFRIWGIPFMPVVAALVVATMFLNLFDINAKGD